MNSMAAVLVVMSLIVAAAAAAVQPARVYADEPETTSSGILRAHVQSDIPYAAPWSSSQTQKLDLYTPLSDISDQPTSSRPIVVFIHGGAWTHGDKSMANRIPLVNTLLQRGYLVASINYRLAAEAVWPAPIEDCKSAVRFLRANASKYGIDPERIALFGESAGAQLALMMNVTNDSDRFVNSSDGNGNASSDIQAVISAFGISDIDSWGKLPGDNIIIANSSKNLLLTGSEEEAYDTSHAKAASPITYASSNVVPILFVHGQDDQMVSYQQSVMMQNALENAGAKHIYSWYPEYGPHASPEVFSQNVIAQKKYLDFLSEVFPVKNNVNVTTLPVYRLYNPSAGIHLYTSNINELIVLQQDWAGSWKVEGIAFRAITASSDKGQIVRRLHNQATGDYVYAASSKEADALINAGWIQDDMFRVPLDGQVNVYRLYEPRSSYHMLVTSERERTFLLHNGWTSEGIAFKAYQ